MSGVVLPIHGRARPDIASGANSQGTASSPNGPQSSACVSRLYENGAALTGWPLGNPVPALAGLKKRRSPDWLAPRQTSFRSSHPSLSNQLVPAIHPGNAIASPDSPKATPDQPSSVRLISSSSPHCIPQKVDRIIDSRIIFQMDQWNGSS